MNLIEKLKNELQTLRKKRLDFLANYIAEFNRIQQGIQDETDIERLKDFWLREIAKSKLETSDKAKLNKFRKECIRELEQSQPGSNDFNRIKNEIHDETKIQSLKTNRFCVDKEISKINDASSLNNERSIDNKIRELKNKNLSGNRDVDTLQ
ncbi:11118_t:CDS:2 [Cetraspora pellucida]|uniref:11118_t:CDS:1 n=1 Tax=Cetraspora pellucida TaxID=1433469 RepID=A0ACA9MKW4_9GLOM|nr:11118_t:CDS:2 [Cetraspora pellucida]